MIGDKDAWPKCERILREELGAHASNAPVAMIEWLIADLKPRFLAMVVDATFSHQGPACCAQAAQKVFDGMSAVASEVFARALWQVFILDVELWKAKFGPTNPPGAGMPDADRFRENVVELFRRAA